MKKNVFKCAVLFFFATGNLLAQDYFSFLNLGDYVVQTQDLSPVYIPKNKLTIGVAANIGLVGYSDIQLGDVLVEDQGVLKLDLDNLNASAKESNAVNYDLSLNLFTLALKTKKGSISLFANTRSSTNWQFSDVFTGLLANGFADSFALKEERLEFTAYNEIGLGYTHQFLDDKLAIGLRVKYLNGMAHIETSENASVGIDIDPLSSYWTVKASDAFVLSSSLDLNESGFPAFTQNTGFGFDFGAAYKLTEKLSFEISVLDVGSIEWSENVKTYQIDDTLGATYDGVNLNTGGDILDEIEDAFGNVIGSTEKAEVFETNLATKIYLSANYQITKNNLFRFSYQETQRLLNTSPSYSLGYNRTLLNSTFGVLVSNGGFDDAPRLGANLAVKLAFLQLYAATDNIASLFGKIEEVNGGGIRVGLNFVFGTKKRAQTDRGTVIGLK